jgi:hypothetical protein
LKCCFFCHLDHPANPKELLCSYATGQRGTEDLVSLPVFRVLFLKFACLSPTFGNQREALRQPGRLLCRSGASNHKKTAPTQRAGAIVEACFSC